MDLHAHFDNPLVRASDKEAGRTLEYHQGRPQDLGGGGPRIFFLRFGNLPCALLGGFGGMFPRENFLKRCNLVRFRVYFDQILSLFF